MNEVEQLMNQNSWGGWAPLAWAMLFVAAPLALGMAIGWLMLLIKLAREPREYCKKCDRWYPRSRTVIARFGHGKPGVRICINCWNLFLWPAKE